MNDPTVVKAALRCLVSLEKGPATVIDISRDSGVALEDCHGLLSLLYRAGLVELRSQGEFGLMQPLAEMSVLDILDAVWETWIDRSAVTMLFGFSTSAASLAVGDSQRS